MATEERTARVLELVRGLTTEVHPHASRLTVTLDSQFDDLGIGSLELAELLLRVQDSFGVALPSHILTSAETPRDSCGPSSTTVLQWSRTSAWPHL
jgi:acyl carrier protein